jgi:hypothetical protein
VLKAVSALVLAVLPLLPSLAHAAAVNAVQLLRFGSVFSQSGTIGWTFSVTRPIEVTSVGVFDFGTDGFQNPAEIGLFDDVGSTLFSATIPTGTEGSTTENTYRWIDVSGPILRPGITYTIADYLDDLAQFMIASQFVIAPEILYMRAVFSNPGDGLEFPTNPAGGMNLYAGPNFRYTIVPEPSAAALLCFGLALLRLRSRFLLARTHKARYCRAGRDAGLAQTRSPMLASMKMLRRRKAGGECVSRYSRRLFREDAKTGSSSGATWLGHSGAPTPRFAAPCSTVAAM